MELDTIHKYWAAMKKWIKIPGSIQRGHQIASGLASDSPYPRGSIEMQVPNFKRLGLDLSSYYAGTLNIFIKPHSFIMHNPMYTFRDVRWAPDFPPDDFSFSPCSITLGDRWYPSYVSYPHPETKTNHFHDGSTLEIMSQYIPLAAFGDQVLLKLDPEEILLNS